MPRKKSVRGRPKTKIASKIIAQPAKQRKFWKNRRAENMQNHLKKVGILSL